MIVTGWVGFDGRRLGGLRRLVDAHQPHVFRRAGGGGAPSQNEQGKQTKEHRAALAPGCTSRRAHGSLPSTLPGVTLMRGTIPTQSDSCRPAHRQAARRLRGASRPSAKAAWASSTGACSRSSRSASPSRCSSREIAGRRDAGAAARRRGRAVNAIRHRGIIDIFSFGQLPDGRPYIVMEFLEGEPLDAYLQRARAAAAARGASSCSIEMLRAARGRARARA